MSAPVVEPAATATGREAVFVARDLSPNAIVDSLRALLPARVHPTAKRRFTLLDTFDHRVSRAGARLVRTGTNGSTTLAWQSSGGRTRHELQTTQPVHFAWDLPDSSLRHALEPVIGVRRLFEQAEVDGHVSSLDMLDRRGKTVARVSVESMQARGSSSRNGWRTVPTVVTVSSLRGYEQAYGRLLAVVGSRPGLEACEEGLTAAIGRTVDIAPGPDAGRLDLGLSASIGAGDAAKRIHLALVAVIEANEPGVRSDFDSEFLHDYRVAVRRTRSLLGQIRDVFPPDVVQHFRVEFSWLGRLTGPPRDIDVLALALRECSGELASRDYDAVGEVLECVRQRERSTLLDALDGERHRLLLSDWRAFLEQPESTLLHAGTPFVEVASRRAWRLYRRILGRAQSVDEGTAAADVHQLRIDAKKLRYVIDVIPGLDDVHRGPVLTSLKKLQRVLGDYNDAEVQERRLIECGQVTDATPPALLALGRLAERQRQRAQALRAPVMEQLAGFCSGETRATFRCAFRDVRVQEDRPCA